LQGARQSGVATWLRTAYDPDQYVRHWEVCQQDGGKTGRNDPQKIRKEAEAEASLSSIAGLPYMLDLVRRAHGAMPSHS
jgi:hypothetical protein